MEKDAVAPPKSAAIKLERLPSILHDSMLPRCV